MSLDARSIYLRRALVVALVGLAALVCVAAAAADQYTVDFCKNWTTDAPVPLLAGYGGFGNDGELVDCAVGGAGAGIHTQHASGIVPAGLESGIALGVPADRPNIAIERVLTDYGVPSANAGSLAFLTFVAGADGLVGGATPLVRSDDLLLPIGTRNLAWVVLCSTSASTNCFFPTVDILDVYKARLYLNESIDPSLTVTGGTLVSPGPQAGIRTLGYDAFDGDSGILDVTVKLGGTVVGHTQYACSYTDWSACRRDRNTQLLDIDTAKVTDGDYPLTVTARDAANNSVIRSAGTVTVDNVTSPSECLACGTGPLTVAPVKPAVTAPAPGAPLAAAGRVANGRNASALAHLSVGYAGTRRRSRRLHFGSRAGVAGTLLDEAGRPIAGASVSVLARPRTAGALATQIGAVQTLADGSFTYILPNGPSRTVTFSYQAFDAQAEPPVKARLGAVVRATVHARARPRAPRSGQTMTLSGALAELPRRGVQVLVEVHDGSIWRTIGVVRTDSHGRFAWRHRFKSISAGGAFTFRAHVSSPIYPFAPGNSPPVTITVRP